MEGQGRKSVPTFLETDGLIGQAIIGLSTSLNLKLVTLKCSVQQSLTFNANRTREQVKTIKDDFWFLISDFRSLISGFWFRVSGFGFLTSDFWFLFSDFGCLISEFVVSDFWFRISNGFRILVFRWRISDNGKFVFWFCKIDFKNLLGIFSDFWFLNKKPRFGRKSGCFAANPISEIRNQKSVLSLRAF